MNESMLKKYAPQLTRCNMQVGNLGDTDSGIEMGLSVGAGIIHMNKGHTSLPFYPPSTLTYGMLVNDKSQRFVNEDSYHGRIGSATLNQSSEKIYFILDTEAYGEYETDNFIVASCRQYRSMTIYTVSCTSPFRLITMKESH